MYHFSYFKETDKQTILSFLEEYPFAFLTFDKNLQYQQNFTKHSITVFVLSAKINTYKELTSPSPKVLSFIKQDNLQIGPIIIS